MRICYFGAKNGLFTSEIIFQKPINKPYSFNSYLSRFNKLKSDANNANWNLIGQEQFWPKLENQISPRYAFSAECERNISTFILHHFQAKTNDFVTFSTNQKYVV